MCPQISKPPKKEAAFCTPSQEIKFPQLVYYFLKVFVLKKFLFMPLSAFVFLPACLFVSHYIRKRTLPGAKVDLMCAFVGYV